MPEKFKSGGYPDMVTPLTEPLKPRDPRSPVNNPPLSNPNDPLGYVSSLGNPKAAGREGSKGGKKR